MHDFICELSDAIALLDHEIKALKAEGRDDEANFARIRLNIHEICRTVYQALARLHEGDALENAYLDKLDALPVNWKTSLDLAKVHGDYEKAAIEELKLSTLAQIRSRYLQLRA